MTTYVTSRPRQALTWVLLAAAAVALLTMRQVDGTLAQVPDAQGAVHVVADLVGPGVLQGTPDVDAAIQLWSTWDGGRRAITTDTIANLAFVLAGMVLLGGILHRLGAVAGKAWLLVGAWGVPDALASILVWLAVRDPGGNWEWLVWVARAKWIAVIALALAVVALVVAPVGTTRIDTIRGREQAARAVRHVQSPIVTLRPLGLVVGLFLLLIALPLGGPLDQFPDVFRRRIDDGTLTAILPPLLGMGLALVAVVAGGFRAIMAHDPSEPDAPARRGVGDPVTPGPGGPGLRARRPVAVATILWAVVIWALVPQVVGRLLGSPVTLASFAPLLIVLAIAAMAGLRAMIHHDEPLGTQVRIAWRAIVATVMAMFRRPADATDATDPTAAQASDPTAAADPTVDGPGTPGTVDLPADVADTVLEEYDRGGLYVAGLAGILVLGGGLGPLRALLPMWIVTGTRGTLTLVSIAMALVLPALVVLGVARWSTTLQALSERRLPFRVLTGGLLGLAALLAAFPFSAPALQLGVLGVTTAYIAAISVAVGGLVALGRHGRPLPVVSSLGGVTRTPWFTLVFAIWFVAGMLDTSGDYHAARVENTGVVASLAHDDWQAATDDWMARTAAWATDGSAQAQGCDGQAVPLVFVAAPGGGIRAGYWTAGVLDELAATQLCGPEPIFAIGGVSGGSVGTSMWLARTADASEEMAVVADEAALAAVVAGLLGRDAVAPFVGITTAWDDRAALLERGWERAWEEPSGLARPWVEVSANDPWAPIALLHGSSSTTGCRTIVTNTGHMAAADQGGCLDDAVGEGPLEAVASLLTQPGDQGVALTTGLRASTAALLSARFPAVSPSGRVIAPCEADETPTCTGTHYVVDGGYYENTGLLSMAQLLPVVEAYIAANRPAGLPADVEPWIVIANNAAPTPTVAPGRPNELLVPLTTKLNSQVIGPEALTQGLAEATDDNIVDVRPGWRPAITPPLGWSLSPTTMCEMDRDIANAFSLGDPACDTPSDTPDMEEGPAAEEGDADDAFLDLQPAPVAEQRSAAQDALARLEAVGRTP